MNTNDDSPLLDLAFFDPSQSKPEGKDAAVDDLINVARCSSCGLYWPGDEAPRFCIICGRTPVYTLEKPVRLPPQTPFSL